jgi:hypothetical protein
METLTMSKRSRKQFTIRLVVAIGVALGGISAIGSVIAYSAVERAWMIAQETATKPFRPPSRRPSSGSVISSSSEESFWANSPASLSHPNPPQPPRFTAGGPLRLIAILR